MIAEGQRALPLLKAAEPKGSLELRMRLERCLKAIGKPDWPDIMAAAARLMKNRRPEGGAAVLLAFALAPRHPAMPAPGTSASVARLRAM